MIHMFEDWPIAFTPPTRKVVEPPMPVTIDLACLIEDSAASPFRADAVPMRVKSEGLDLNRHVPGWIHAWARTTSLHFVKLQSVACDPVSQVTEMPAFRMDRM